MIIISEVIQNGSIYALAGALAGFMSGILGIGGGIIIVPALLYIFYHNDIIPPDLIMQVAAGTSLAAMIFTSHSTITAHHKRGNILWNLFMRLWPAIVVGAICGGLLADIIPTYWLKLSFGLFLLLMAFKMLSGVHLPEQRKLPAPWVNTLVTFFIGLLSGLFGVGGGTLIIPYLTVCGIPARQITALSALCTLAASVVGAITFILVGLNEAALPAYSTGYVYWPAVIWIAIPSILFAQIGAKLMYALPVKQLKYGFIITLILTAIDILGSAIQSWI